MQVNANNIHVLYCIGRLILDITPVIGFWLVHMSLYIKGNKVNQQNECALLELFNIFLNLSP